MLGVNQKAVGATVGATLLEADGLNVDRFTPPTDSRDHTATAVARKWPQSPCDSCCRCCCHSSRRHSWVQSGR